MRTDLRAPAIGSIAVAALLITGSTSPAAERGGADAPDRRNHDVLIRTYNNYGLTASAMVAARVRAGGILQNAGLQAVWRDCSTGCADPLGPGELLVRIVAAPEGVVAQSLGSALVNLQDRSGALATVYADRVSLVAARTGVDAATLLGRAIAHEIGHLLLGSAQHSAAGLMRAFWSDRELHRDLAADWTWSPEDLSRLTRGFVARAEPSRRAPFRDAER
jgi:hypothetical protein